MKRIENKLKQVAERIGINYVFDNWSGANVRLDNESLPVMVNVLPVSGGFRSKGFGVGVYANCLIAFLDKCDLDFKADEATEVVYRMEEYARRFILACNKSGYFEPININEVQFQVCYDKMDVNLTGVILEFAVEDAEEVCDDVLNYMRNGN